MDILTYLQEQLNAHQYAAASFTDGDSLILAWAWSGKTRTLTYKIAYLLYWKQVDPQNLLAVTFTNKAAAEMKERLHQILKEMDATLSLKGWDEVSSLDFDAMLSNSHSDSSWWQSREFKPHDFKWIGTFHGIFLKMLKLDIEKLWVWYTSSFTIYDAWDQKSLIKWILKNENMSDMIELREVQRQISERKNKWRLPEQAVHHANSQQQEWTLDVYKKYQSSLLEANAVDFDDLLLLTKHLLDANPEVLSKWQTQFQHILVDEAQDTNTIQFELMKQLTWWWAYITFIGDDYQSIYRRRWAVMENFLNVKRWRPTIEIFKLEINYRSKPHIVEAGSAIISNNTKQYDKAIKAHRDWEDKIRLFTFSDEVDEANQIVELITKYKEETSKQWSDFTILYRTNAQSSPFEQILLTDWIPYTVVWAFKFFERSEIKDMIGYIKYILNPKDNLALERIINTPNRKIGKTTVQNLYDAANAQWISFATLVFNIDTFPAVLKPAAQTKIRQFSTMMKWLITMVDMVPPAQLIEQIVQWTHYKDYLVKAEWPDRAEERMENIGQLINIAAKYEAPWSESLLQFIDEVSLMGSLDTGSEATDTIKLMSVHASKGLEFPYVFIVGMEEDIFPLSKAKFDDAELEEERRWAYVAITRAKDHLFISHANSRQQRWQTKYNQPSRFIEELPEHLLKRYNLAWSWIAKAQANEFYEWDFVKHKLFGHWSVLEVRGSVCIVRFNNPKFGVRKLDAKFLQSGE